MKTIELTLSSVTGAVIDAVDAVPGVRGIVADETKPTLRVHIEGEDGEAVRAAAERAGAEVHRFVTRETTPEELDTEADGDNVRDMGYLIYSRPEHDVEATDR